MTSNLFSYFVFNSQMPRTHAADLRTQFEKCIREDGTMDIAIYEEFFKRNRLDDCPLLPVGTARAEWFNSAKTFMDESQVVVSKTRGTNGPFLGQELPPLDYNDCWYLNKWLMVTVYGDLGSLTYLLCGTPSMELYIVFGYVTRWYQPSAFGTCGFSSLFIIAEEGCREI